MDFIAVLDYLFRPINLFFFCFGVFSVLVIQMLPKLGDENIVLKSREVFIARFSHWAGMFAILAILYLMCAPNGWLYDDFMAFTKKAILLHPDWVSEVTLKAPNGYTFGCYYGECMNRTLICNRFECGYKFPRNETDLPPASIFPNTTEYYVNGTWLVITNQSAYIPRRPEIR